MQPLVNGGVVTHILLHHHKSAVFQLNAGLQEIARVGPQGGLVEKKKELDTIVEETAKEEAALLKERESLVSQIDERMMVAYTKVRANAHNKLAVVTVTRDACGGCFNKIPPQRRLDIEESKKIIVCEYCGRILVSSSFEEGK